MINRSTPYYPTGSTSTVTIVNETTPIYGPGGFTYTTIESRSVRVVSPQMYRRGCALYLLIVAISLCSFGIIPIIAGAVILKDSSFDELGGVIPMAFGGTIFFVGVCLFIASCCVAKRTPPEQSPISASTTGDLNTASGQTTSPSGQGINGQFSQPGAFGQNPPTYTGLNHQYPPAYQPTSAQYAQQNQGFFGGQNPPQYQGSSATPYQSSAHQFEKPYQQ